ncbi:amino acid adenylation domain-containing protein [Massilia sp. erpn]|uniref:non-ribosomal peptide synthetase n=1 Tax=Massilia sp. erpn TaxID=2738142 RepID=UPI002102F607|nr:amino acid adenylation domain-containing protein [Massilia sp. erpn]UTY57074.1 amino acid adenylation domain-containing protein [Massilia sp. erpn]
MTLHPLTTAQQGLWFLSQFDQLTNAAYTMVYAFEASHDLEEGKLRQALAILSKRHPMLRSRITPVGGIPHMEVRDADQGAALPLSQSCETIDAVASMQSALPFDTQEQHLYRVVMVAPALTPPSRPGLVFAFHHIMFDNASAHAFFLELSQLYTELAAGRMAEASGLPVSLEAAVSAEQAFMESAQGIAETEQAVARLRGIPSSLALPRKRPRGDDEVVFPAAFAVVPLPAALASAVAEQARRLRATPAAVYLSAFQLLLWQYSGQHDFGVAIPVANRRHDVPESALGYFVNMGIVRAAISPSASGADLIASVRDQLFDTMDLAAVPFPILAKRLKRGGDDIQGPLQQIGFNYLHGQQRSWQFGACRLVAQATRPSYSKNEFKLDIQESDGEVECCFLYDGSGYDALLIQQMAAHYRYLLEAVVAAPTTLLRDLPLQAPDQARRLLADFNQHAAGALETRCLHQLFEQQVERTPSATALLFGEQVLSYAELNLRANRLAHALRADGVGPDTLVGLCVERGCDMVVGMLAILKAGGAYVPLDPDYPAERLAYMLDDTRAPVLLLQRHLAARLPSHAARVHWLDEAGTAPGQPDGNPPNRTLPQHLAYCIYTSGSTGGPKGAINTHQGVANLLAWYCPGQAGGERIMLASSLSFDLTQKNILGPLLAGATLVIPCGGAADVAAFQDALQRHRPSRINCAPSAYRAYMEAAQPHSLRTVVLGGEPIDQALAAALAAQGIALVNSYGPTECADVALFHRQEPDAAAGPLPLGRPLPHVRVYVLDAALVPVPPGVAGEIHIAGSGLARGYLNRPGLSADRFIPDPYGPPGSRMYRTGDLGRHTSAGTIEFIGRLDHQVKIRGHRIELGEIEQALLRCQDVREAVITAPADPAGERHLVAYVAGTAGRLDTAALSQQLQQVLPAYMLPAAWVVLDAFPLNPNGKIDRAALPAPANDRIGAPADSIQPSTPTEKLLAEIWATVLKREQISLNDNFFMLGGHSLLASQVVAKIRERKGYAVPLRMLFDAPTVAELARQLDSLPPQSRTRPEITPIARQARNAFKKRV